MMLAELICKKCGKPSYINKNLVHLDPEYPNEKCQFQWHCTYCRTEIDMKDTRRNHEL